MNKELEKIKDAWSKDTGDGRDEKARELAAAYVDAHPELYEGLPAVLKRLPESKRVPLLVQMESDCRDQGDEEGEWNMEAFILARVPKQNIGGEYAAEIRLP